MILTDEQKQIIEQLYVDIVVDACAGSGKTTTAAQRLIYLKQNYGHLGAIALLSYSNTAVKEFKTIYNQSCSHNHAKTQPFEVYIATVDSFLTNYILNYHSYRYMQCEKRPFLVFGGEKFLDGYKILLGNSSIPLEINNLDFYMSNNGSIKLSYAVKGKKIKINDATDINKCKHTIARFMKIGAYTHNMRKLIALSTIKKEPKLIQILAKKFPYILIDEAQDVGTIHQAIFELLHKHGTKFFLIGDSNQAIYGYADADGSFLRNFLPLSAKRLSLSINRRSVSRITAVASSISSTLMTSSSTREYSSDGAYYVTYKNGEEQKLVYNFLQYLNDKNYSTDNSAVLARNKMILNKINGAEQSGHGTIRYFVEATILRDRGATGIGFEKMVLGIARLFDHLPERWVYNILNYNSNIECKKCRNKLWLFYKNQDLAGLPSSSLHPKDGWLPLLKTNIVALLNKLESEQALTVSKNIGHKLTSKKLSDNFINSPSCTNLASKIRIDTVHQAKGESLEAVLYITSESHLSALLKGLLKEDGRIGYVAITRAKYLFVLAVPHDYLSKFSVDLEKHNIKQLSDWGDFCACSSIKDR